MYSGLLGLGLRLGSDLRVRALYYGLLGSGLGSGLGVGLESGLRVRALYYGLLGLGFDLRVRALHYGLFQRAACHGGLVSSEDNKSSDTTDKI